MFSAVVSGPHSELAFSRTHFSPARSRLFLQAAQLLFCAFCAVKQSLAELADADTRVIEWTRKAGVCLRRQHDPGDAEGPKPRQSLLIGSAVELLGGLRPLPPGNCRLTKVAGDAAVFEIIGDCASLRGCAKALRILARPFNVVVIQGEDRILGSIGANPQEGLLPGIAWRQPRPFHMAGGWIGEPLGGKHDEQKRHVE